MFYLSYDADFEDDPKPTNNSDVLRFLTRMVIEKQQRSDNRSRMMERGRVSIGGGMNEIDHEDEEEELGGTG